MSEQKQVVEQSETSKKDFLERIIQKLSEHGVRSLEGSLVECKNALKRNTVSKVLPLNAQKEIYHLGTGAYYAAIDVGIPVAYAAITLKAFSWIPPVHHSWNRVDHDLRMALIASLVLGAYTVRYGVVKSLMAPFKTIDEKLFQLSPEYKAAQATNFSERIREFLINPKTTTKYKIKMRKRDFTLPFNDPFDAVYGFELQTRDGEKLAKLSYEFERGFPVIKQIQGIEGELERLRPLRWEELMVTATGDVMKKANHKKIGIQPGNQHMWCWPRHMTLKQAQKRYDNVAQRMGFEMDSKSGYWTKELNAEPANHDLK